MTFFCIEIPKRPFSMAYSVVTFIRPPSDSEAMKSDARVEHNSTAAVGRVTEYQVSHLTVTPRTQNGWRNP